jgi:hypothetical protein
MAVPVDFNGKTHYSQSANALLRVSTLARAIEPDFFEKYKGKNSWYLPRMVARVVKQLTVNR